MAVTFLLGILLGATGFYLAKLPGKSFLVPQTIKEKARPLDKYTYENLSKRNWQPTELKIESELDSKPTSLKPPYNFKSYLFSFVVDNKKITGQINVPDNLITRSPDTQVSTILMFRGYAPKESYSTGTGTKNAAAVFSQNGFITVAPDFLGYGDSDPRDEDEMAGRFESYPIALTLLRSLMDPKFVCAPTYESCSVDNWPLSVENLFLWGHSNGGHLALSTLEIANHSPSFADKAFPTVLWAPVTKPFPYSTLVYTDEADDLGKMQRKSLAKFEEDYDVNLYSIHNYTDWIKSPIQLNQGTADEEVPYWWSKEFVKTLKEKHEDKKADFTIFLYPGMSHNMQPGWNTAVARNLAFFNSFR